MHVSGDARCTNDDSAFRETRRDTDYYIMVYWLCYLFIYINLQRGLQTRVPYRLTKHFTYYDI